MPILVSGVCFKVYFFQLCPTMFEGRPDAILQDPFRRYTLYVCVCVSN